ncbi:hypothetical protein S83_059585 [Arachis hypogaea]|nr:uncharacterized protein DS421_17g587160 [Arachis hypogaea]
MWTCRLIYNIRQISIYDPCSAAESTKHKQVTFFSSKVWKYLIFTSRLKYKELYLFLVARARTSILNVSVILEMKYSVASTTSIGSEFGNLYKFVSILIASLLLINAF